MFDFTPEEIRVLKQSWEKLRVEEYKLSEAHYNKLFSKIPNIEELFSVSRDIQGKRLIMSFSEILRYYPQDRDKAVVYIMNLGMRHKSYKVEEKYYTIFKEVIIEAFTEIMDPEFSQQEIDLWDRFIGSTCNLMLSGGRERKKKINN